MNHKNILITGASSGFGQLMAIALVDKGYKVWASMRNLEGKNSAKAEELRNKIQTGSGTLELMELDVTNTLSVKKAIDRIRETDGRLDVIVNNAGVGSKALLEDFTEEMLNNLFDVNVYGVFRVTKAALPMMKDQKDGLVINISSGLGRYCLPTFTYYNASKWALEALAQSWRYEFAPLGIDCVLVEPGAFPTTGFKGNMEAFSVDASSKAAEYGNLFKLHSNFEAMVAQQIKEGTVNNPQMVSDAVVKLIETPKGDRPFRTVVDAMSKQVLDPYNKMLDDIQQNLLNNFGIGELTQPKM
jgi:NAD(P)-dependent dehydrogenase (short-subunit alcohol dehydrogenase family)